MKLLVLTTRLFERPANGGELCTARLLAALWAQGHELHVVGRGPAPPDGEGLRFSSLGPAVPPAAEMPALARAASLAAACWRRQAWTVHRTGAGGALARARRLLRKAANEADLVIVDHLQAWAWLEAALPGTPRPLMLVMHNLESDGYRPRNTTPQGTEGWADTARARLQRWVLAREARLLRSLEDRALRHAGAVACLNDDDARVLRERMAALGGRGRVEVLPGYPLQGPASLRPHDAAAAASAATPGAGHCIGLIGTWTWAPNRRALQWVLSQVRPRLPAGCTLVLAGAGLEQVADAPGVVKLGRVADVATFYAGIDVLALAALDGSGVQEKAIEALGTGLPVVATPLALRGLQPLPEGVRVAEDAAAFAEACTAALAQAPHRQSPAALAAWSQQRRQRYDAALAACLTAALAGAPPATPGVAPSVTPSVVPVATQQAASPP